MTDTWSIHRATLVGAYDSAVPGFASLRTQKKVWVYSDGTFVTADFATLSAGWHLLTSYHAADTTVTGTELAPSLDTVWQQAFDVTPFSTTPSISSIGQDAHTELDTSYSVSAIMNTVSGDGSLALYICDWYAGSTFLTTTMHAVSGRSISSGRIYFGGESAHVVVKYQNADGINGPTMTSGNVIITV
jgi:hypothetical protein